MTLEQTVLLLVLSAALFLFVTERWRYDVVALLALLAVTLTGIVPAEKAFAGFGHGAVITVAAVLVIGRALQNSGLVDLLSNWVLRVGDRPTLQVLALTAVVAALSAFMNNVGALALLLPMAIRMARKSGHPPSLLLMPLAFGSLLGGMTTLIGTPPNIIIASFRAQAGSPPFGMFDFTPVGAGVTLAGIFYMSLIGWRLIPKRKGQLSREELFQIEEYVAEVRVPEDSKLGGKSLRELEEAVESDVTVVGLVRGERRVLAPSRYQTLQPRDILIVEADSETLKALLDATKLELVGDKEHEEQALGSDEVAVVEAVVRPRSPLEGNTAWTFNLRWRYGVNLLGVARQGARLRERLKNIQFRAGDVLLLQGRTDALQETLAAIGCLPLAERGLRFGPQRLVLALGIFALSVAALATGLLPAPVALVAAAVLMVLFNLVSLRETYDAIDWPVIVLLGAMIPVGEALDTTGGSKLIAEQLLKVATEIPAGATVAMVLIGAMILTPLINNAAAAILLAPIAISVASGLGASPDPFLMAVCVGASCDFLTPIGHQSNTLVMGPGGYKFADYARMGFPLEAIIVLIGVPLILWFWPTGV
jgi:di/tricarboxylate transporter